MISTRKNVVAGSIILSLVPAWSMRNQLASESTSEQQVVQTIKEFLQQRDLGSQGLLNEIFESWTPGLGPNYVENLKIVVDKIESHLEPKVKDGQKATQVKLDAFFKGLEGASAAMTSAKTTADADDKGWFQCVATEQDKRQAAEREAQSLTKSRSGENEACQLQQDNAGFVWGAAGKFENSFTCNHTAGKCDAAFQKFQESVRQRESHLSSALTKAQANYNSLAAACASKKKQRVEAQSAATSAESAWATQRAHCVKLASTRQSSLCAFGSSAQAKCQAESEFNAFVAKTKQAKGDAHSEVDRSSEWSALQAAKCMVAKSIQKGLGNAITSADMDECASKANFAQDVGSLNTRMAAFDTLSGANKCSLGKVTFSNGQKWNVPEEAKPQSSAYVRAAFSPEFNPADGNFDFCPVTCKCTTPLAGKAEWNEYTCNDGTRAHCASNQTCFATSFIKGDWSNACSETAPTQNGQ